MPGAKTLGVMPGGSNYDAAKRVEAENEMHHAGTALRVRPFSLLAAPKIKTNRKIPQISLMDGLNLW